MGKYPEKLVDRCARSGVRLENVQRRGPAFIADIAMRDMKRLRKALKGIFPIIDDERRFKITRPRTVIPGSSDGNGYHYTRIQSKMTTLV